MLSLLLAPSALADPPDTTIVTGPSGLTTDNTPTFTFTSDDGTSFECRVDADAFAAFEETGDPVNPVLAERLRKNIYAAGGSKDPEELYTAFRGKMPSPEAMMVKRGLV